MWVKWLRIGILLILPALVLATAESPDSTTENPLSPLDLSSPRATLNTFFEEVGALERIASEEFWSNPSKEVSQRLANQSRVIHRMLDLSAIPPAARFERGNDVYIYLYEVLSRINLPPEEEIPDRSSFADFTATLKTTAEDSATQDSGVLPTLKPDAAGTKPAEPGVVKSVSWTIPNTEITLVQVAEGPQAGQFIFSADTVARAGDFYDRVKHLPYQRDVVFENYPELRPFLTMRGWLIPPRVVNALPAWMKVSIFKQAVWKWLALVVVLLLYAAALVFLHKFSVRLQSRRKIVSELAKFLVPLVVLLCTAPLMNQVVQQLTLTDRVGEGLAFMAEVITFLALAWVVWFASLSITEGYISASRVQGESLNAHLLRFVARTLGIIAVIVIIFMLSARLGAPLFSLIAGFGVGGIAVALAAQGSIENFIGSLNLFGDKPVRVGDICRYGEDIAPDLQRIGTVEAIGMRSTRIRGVDGSLTTIPNADFCKMHIVNYSLRSSILMQSTIGLRYETTDDQLRFVLVSIREMLVAHPKVVDDEPSVRFVGFGDSALNIEVRADLSTADFFDFRAIREDIFLRIMKIVRNSGSGFAFPSQTLYYAEDSGLDMERQHSAESKVREWAAAQQMPFPTFTREQRAKTRNTLDYPPEGSPQADQ